MPDRPPMQTHVVQNRLTFSGFGAILGKTGQIFHSLASQRAGQTLKLGDKSSFSQKTKIRNKNLERLPISQVHQEL